MRRLLLVICLGVVTTSHAADPGFAFLRLAAGARAAAMGDATTALTGAESAAANPAALPDGRAGTLSHTEWIGDIRHEHGATSWPALGGALAADVRVSHTGDLERRVGPSTDPVGSFGVYEWTAGLTYRRSLQPGLQAGLSTRFARQSIDADAASGAAFDVGLLYGDGPWWVGAAVRNLGSLSDLGQQPTDLPLQVRVGGALLRGAALLSGDVHWTRDVETSLHVGAEFRVRRHLLLRAGVQTADTRDVSLGLGVPVGPWRVDYAYVPFSDGLGQAHRVSLVWSGPTVQ